MPAALPRQLSMAFGLGASSTNTTCHTRRRPGSALCQLGSEEWGGGAPVKDPRRRSTSSMAILRQAGPPPCTFSKSAPPPLVDPGFLQLLESSAIRIQRWFRAHLQRRHHQLHVQKQQVHALLDFNREKWLKTVQALREGVQENKTRMRNQNQKTKMVKAVKVEESLDTVRPSEPPILEQESCTEKSAPLSLDGAKMQVQPTPPAKEKLSSRPPSVARLSTANARKPSPVVSAPKQNISGNKNRAGTTKATPVLTGTRRKNSPMAVKKDTVEAPIVPPSNASAAWCSGASHEEAAGKEEQEMLDCIIAELNPKKKGTKSDLEETNRNGVPSKTTEETVELVEEQQDAKQATVASVVVAEQEQKAVSEQKEPTHAKPSDSDQPLFAAKPPKMPSTSVPTPIPTYSCEQHVTPPASTLTTATTEVYQSALTENEESSMEGDVYPSFEGKYGYRIGGGTSGDSTDKRVHRILSYLKSVEVDACSPQGTKHFAEPMDDGSSSTEDLRNSTATTNVALMELKARTMGQQMEIDDKTRTILLLKKEMKRAKEAHDAATQQHAKDMKSKLTMQRKEYEQIINRHLSFIDKVLVEKEDLSKRCEALTEECKVLEKQFKDKYTQQEETHARELKQKKDLWESAEKLRRDKWIQERTKVIKDQTIKGLEPEIQKLITQHKAQQKRLEEKYRVDLAREREVLVEQHQAQLDQFRDKIATERRRAAEEERDFARQRYQKQLEREEMEFQQQKRKMQAAFEEQKDRLVQSLREEKSVEEKNWRRVLEDVQNQLERQRVASEEATKVVQRKHVTELEKLQEMMTMEKEEWQTQYIHKTELEIKNKERQLREKLIQERDAEIDLVIRRLESESTSNSGDLVRQHRSEIERLKQEHLDELKQAREQGSIAVDKILDLRKKLEELEAKSNDTQKELLRVQNELAVKDNLLRMQKTDLKRLHMDEEALKQILRKSLEQELTEKDQELHHLRRLQSEQTARERQLTQSLESRLENVQQQKDQELQMVEAQVCQALKAKDKAISDLRRKLEESVMKGKQLEMLVEKQRKEILNSV